MSEILLFDKNFKPKKCDYCHENKVKKWNDGLPTYCCNECAVLAQPDKTIIQRNTGTFA